MFGSNRGAVSKSRDKGFVYSVWMRELGEAGSDGEEESSIVLGRCSSFKALTEGERRAERRCPPAGVVGRDILAQQGESAAGERSKG